jgi:hypothetical protein
MAGTGWQSADLLTRFNQVAGRPTTDAISDAAKYVRLSDAQESVLARIAAIAGSQQDQAPTAMTTADGGKTWTFGTDGNGYAVYPLGAKVFPTLTAIPDYPWTPGIDYLDEGTQIRMPNNLSWTGQLYWRGVVGPPAITASVQPVLQPPAARILVVLEAARSFAEEYVRNGPLADRMAARFEREFASQMTSIRRHLRGNGTVSLFGWSMGIGRSGLTFLG